MLARISRLPPAWLTAAFGLLTLGPLLLLAYFAITRSSDAVEREASARVQSTAAVTADFVRAELDGLAGVVDAYAKQRSMIAAVENRDRGRSDTEPVAAHLQDLREARPGIALAVLTDASGSLIDVVPATPTSIGDDFSHRDWYQGVIRSGRPYVSEAYVTRATGGGRVVAAAAVVVGGTPRRPLGVLVAGYSLRYVQSFADRMARQQGIALTVTDQAGVVVAAPGTPTDTLVSIAADVRVQAALRGEAGILRHAGAGGKNVAAYAPVARHGWTVIASVPREEGAFASVHALRNAVLALTTLLGLVLLAGIAALGLTLRRRAQLDKELAAQHRELARAHAFSERLAQETEVAAVAARILDQIGDAAHAELGTLHALDLDGNLELVAERASGAGEAAFALTGDAAVADVIAEEQTVVVEGKTGFLLCVPLVHAWRPLGLVTLSRLSGGNFSDAERETAEHFADQAAVALASAFALREVQRLAALSRAVLDATADAIRMVDLEGRTVLANTAQWETTAGAFAVPEDVSIWGSTVALANRTTDPAGYRAAVQGLTADTESEGIDVYQIAETGGWIQRYSGPVRNADGLVVGRIFVARDITAQREAEQLKSDLVATVSHELRTPLTGILGFAEMLAMDDIDDESRRDYVETIQRQGARLRDLIDDFLDVQRIEEGTFRVELQPVPLSELLREQATLFEMNSSLHAIQLDLDDGVTVLGEPDRIAQVIGNLLSNAIKYSPEGGPVEVRLRDAGATIRVEVTDAGIGIPPDQRRRIFEKFFRVDSTDTRRIGGTGLGLALSRDIVEAHGGTIGFTSVAGQGTTFWFELPRVRA